MTKTRTRYRRRFLTEEISYTTQTPLRVDREKGIIYGCKVIGLQSVNRRRYLLECLRRDKDLYEGIIVNVNHPEKPRDGRKIQEMFGKLINVRCEADGLYADLEFLKTHPCAEQICESAERFPDLFGLSHNAQADGVDEPDGTFVIHRITEVRSVDVVSSPATTGGLFEQKGHTMLTVKQLFESTAPRLKPWRRARLQKLMAVMEEDPGMMAECPPESGDDGAGTDPEGELWAGFRAAIHAIIDDASMDVKTKTKKIGEYFRAHEKITAKDDDKDETEQEDDEPEKDSDKSGENPKSTDGDAKDDEKGAKGKKVDSNEQVELQLLRRKDKARELLEQANIAGDKEFLEILLATKTDDAMAKLVDREKRLRLAKTPRSGNVTEQAKQSGGLDTVEGFMTALRSGGR